MDGCIGVFEVVKFHTKRHRANLIDRVFRGYVVDSFDFYWRDWHWPAFNLADIAIVLGALLLVSSSLLGKKANTNAESDGSD